MVREPKEAAPIPCKKRNAKRVLKSRASEHAPPAIPKSSKEGTKILFLPNRSASMPKTGINRTPGRQNTAMSKSTLGSEMLNATRISGNAGVIRVVPKIADKETKKTMLRFKSR